MPAANKLIVLSFGTFGAVGGRQMFGDHETAMVERGLAFHGLVTIEAGDALRGMLTRFELVHDGGCFLPVAFRALSDSSGCGRGRLPSFNIRTAAVDNEGGNDEGRSNDDSDEHALKRHSRYSKESIPECGVRLTPR